MHSIEGITAKLELLQTLDETVIAEVEEEEEYSTLIIEADDYATTIREHLTRYKSVLRRTTEPETLTSVPFVPAASAETPSTRPKKSQPTEADAHTFLRRHPTMAEFHRQFPSSSG